MEREKDHEGIGRSIIPVINRLQDLFASVSAATSSSLSHDGESDEARNAAGEELALELPQIAVVGSQSSGKSSVLEALVGRDFLPRGPDICTRRPLVLQLVQTAAHAPGSTEWGEFLHAPGKKFTSFSSIRKEIQSETDRETGTNKNVSNKQIRLKIYSPHVLTMTLVDLPGMTKVPVGDQPSDIEQRIRDMVMSYIKHETCIILAVSPANADLANSEALKIARQADPEGIRTIGVVTKMDIMDRGTDASAILRNEVVPLSLGYVGVVNRCQADIAQNIPIRAALSQEEAFFKGHVAYSRVLQHCGTQRLAQRLNSILVSHIQRMLPELRSKLAAQGRLLEKEVEAFGDFEPDSLTAKGALLLQILTEFSSNVRRALEGESANMSTTELQGGARVLYIVRDIFARALNLDEPLAYITNEEIRTVIQNASGVKGSLLMPEEPFHLLARRHISRLLEPSLECTSLVHMELARICQTAMPAGVKRFPNLQRSIDECVSSFLDECRLPACSMIQNLIEVQLAYINTSHPEFIGGSEAVSRAMKSTTSSLTTPAGKENNAYHMQRNNNNNNNNNGSSSSSSSPTATLLSMQSPRGGLKDLQFGEMGSAKKGGGGGAGAGGGGGGGGGGGHTTIRTADTLFMQGREKLDNNNGSTKAGRRSEEEEEGGGGGRSPSLECFITPMGKDRRISLQGPPPVLHATQPFTPQEHVEIGVTRELLNSYHNIVLKSMQDLVPKTVHHFQVNSVQNNLQKFLIGQLYRERRVEDLMVEHDEVAKKRRALSSALEIVKKANNVMDTLPNELFRRLEIGG